MAEEAEDLFGELKKYAASDMYPFHMPGHKRRSGWQIDPYACDITEVEGFDDLHHPEGRLKRSQEWAAHIYGADKTYYLVNGSTCGILAAVSAAVPFGGELLLARNAHHSAYNAVALDHLRIASIYPQKVDKWGIFGQIYPETVDKMLLSNPEASAVLIVSPTYDGVISDIRSIAEIVHRKGIPLIVDEAHGAHLKFTSAYTSALDCGADVVVQSLHKTLPALTQTALLHVRGDLIDTDRLERYLRMFQSSSPSYILLGSAEACIHEAEAGAPGEWDGHYTRLSAFRKSLAGLSAIQLPGRGRLKGLDGIYDFDDSRLIISVKGCVIRDRGSDGALPRFADGLWLSSRLRDKYHLEMEMAADTYVLGITTPFDSDEGFERLGAALTQIDKELERIKEPVRRRGPRESEGTFLKPQFTVAAALDKPYETVPILESPGRAAAEFAYIYPPGIPIVIPGECIDDDTIRTLLEWHSKGFSLQGMADKSASTIRVVK